MSGGKHSVIIDTDPGVDDAIALLFAFLSPNIDIRAITLTQGNTTIENAFRNIKQILAVQAAHERYLASTAPTDIKVAPPAALVSRESPVVIALGQGIPLEGEAEYAHHFHGEDGLGNYFTMNPPNGSGDGQTEAVSKAAAAAGAKTPDAGAEGLYTVSERSAEDEIIHQLQSHPDKTITILALGPLSNVARAMQKAPETMKKVKHIISMGGAINHPGNITPVSEFNWFADGLAAHLVIASSLPVRVLPLDVTMVSAVVESRYLYEHVAALSTPLSNFVTQIIQHILQLTERSWGYRWLTMHDPLTIGCLVDNSLVEFEPLHFEVEPSGKLTRGMCIIDRRPPKLNEPAPAATKRKNVEVAVRGDTHKFLKLFYYTLFGLDWDTLKKTTS
ncbi:uncharacterized protein SPPG_01308 [Spizellomyces punctatus DAOM BR117]|uniref:Inosine/uridine-preferring nucleoside hydrolase domain-containing protein n=1 Tax=Spizellomyces punctatus (strain DAOM BR117) TaxID=645134 RepID=A0A0L0HSK8_SPIPD|nr:uncharacterized protein SPPG_01308 [Spizellomyces punctatus DAOM BR117]KND03854.1 hypothetical protein SPPG_01308 [Spizellomyces punctatus DAOM BR117]|eukprot:XP_016611893.1 hypothetical protein SPPG_01308 [Spizellomyces punctatus DAOM BR117]